MAFPEQSRPSISIMASPNRLQEVLRNRSLPPRCLRQRSFNAAIKEREEADLLNQLHHACCWIYFRKIHVHLFLSFVLKHFNHIFVATHELAASVLHSGVRETAFLHDSSRCRIACKMVCPDVFEMLLVDAVVKHQLQGFGADSLVPKWLSYPVAHLTVVFSDRDVSNTFL